MTTSPRNLLLDSLPAAVADEIKSRLRPVPLPKRTVLYEPQEMPQYAHFMTSGIASVVVETPDGAIAEVNLLGHEALVESMHLLGPTPMLTRCFMQVEGTALCMPFKELRQIFLQCEPLRRWVLQFVQNQAALTSQIAACNRLHSAEERMARWLLMVQDRVESKGLPLTQEFLGQMLGARRSTVALAASALQAGGLIKYRRGIVEILDRENLALAACDCYPLLKGLLRSLYSAA
ncbi:MAG: Crp/Fnr family transcriptional regulator [Acidobacteria bacterium]|nr:Crp/Fnr family transcriptional regulator [Acidobacteriota bacterium]